jgi:hypothetical protein
MRKEAASSLDLRNLRILSPVLSPGFTACSIGSPAEIVLQSFAERLLFLSDCDQLNRVVSRAGGNDCASGAAVWHESNEGAYLASGDRALISLHGALMLVSPPSLVLINGDILGVMDLAQIDRTMKWLTASPAQSSFVGSPLVIVSDD